MAILLIRSTGEIPLVRCDGVLMRFDAPLVAGVDGRAEEVIVFPAAGLLLPAEREVSGRYDLDEVHEVIRLLGRCLLRVIQGVNVVVSPPSRAGIRMLLLHICDDGGAELGAEAQVVDLVGKGVGLVFEVVLQVVHVHVSVGEGFPGRDVEVADDFVDFDGAFETTAFFALGVEVFGVVFALALFDAFATAEGPADGGVGVADIVAGVAAAGLGGVGRGWGTVAFTAVVGVEVGGFVFVAETYISECGG